MWRDKWRQMYERDPITTWVDGRIALLGDAAHPPLQYMAQGAIMAIEDGWVLAEHVKRLRGDDGAVDWAGALAAYEAVRPEHCRRVVLTARVWGGTRRAQQPVEVEETVLVLRPQLHPRSVRGELVDEGHAVAAPPAVDQRPLRAGRR